MENTVAKKLDSLVKLQSIDSERDELIKVRGALPDEVMDLEDEIAGYQTRVEKQNQEMVPPRQVQYNLATLLLLLLFLSSVLLGRGGSATEV